MINYALSLILFISSIPSEEVIDKRFNALVSEASKHYASNDMEQAIDFATKAHEMAIDYRHDWGEAKALFVLAFLHEKSFEYEKALPYYFEVLNQYDKFDDIRSHKDKCKVYLNLGNIMLSHSKYQQAIAFYDKGINLSRKYQLNKVLQDIMQNKVITYRESKNYEMAIATINEKEAVSDNEQLIDKLRNLKYYL